MDLGFGDYFKFVFALIFVLALIAVFAALARRMGLGYRTASRGKSKRLSIVEVIPIDPKRRLALVRRDEVEHLLLLGTGNNPDLLIESGIPVDAADFAGALAKATANPQEGKAP